MASLDTYILYGRTAQLADLGAYNAAWQFYHSTFIYNKHSGLFLLAFILELIKRPLLGNFFQIIYPYRRWVTRNTHLQKTDDFVLILTW